MTNTAKGNPTESFIKRGGEMGELIRSFPWQNTPLGSIETWPLSLRTLVNMMLASRFPMLIFWGRDLITFYNDAFRPSLGNDGKHPSSLGQRGEISWAESWPVIGPMIYNIMAGGDAVWFEDQKLPIYREGKMGYAYWTYSFSPVTDDEGETNGILVTCTETTKAVEAIESLGRSEGQFQNLVRETATGIAVMMGQNFKIEIVNAAFAQMVGRTAEELIGKNEFDVIPEAEAEFRPIMEKAMNQNEPTYLNNTPYKVFDKKGEEIEGVVNITYQPYKEANGKVTGLIVLCQDVTIQQKAEQQIIENEQRLLASFNDLTVGIAIIGQENLTIQMVNPFYGELVGRTPDQLTGKPLLEALPELAGQGFDNLLQGVIATGVPFVSNEVSAKLVRYGKLETIYVNLTYQPRIEAANGEIAGVLVVATDVTEQVNARKKIEVAEENLRMAIDAAALATFSMDVDNRKLYASLRLKEFFGYGPDEDMPYEAAAAQIREDYRQGVLDGVEAAILQNVPFDREYPVIGHSDGKTRWVRAVGTLQTRNDGKNYYTGILNDITEKKLDEIRKNDFIGMVSHELKTPLTSMSGYLQFLQAKATKNGDTFTNGILQKANKQIGKMTTMINGFLNVSRLESGKIYIDKTRFDLAGLVKEAEEEIIASINSHKVVFAPVLPTFVMADRDKISHVISNLISNAIKYSPATSVVNVACITKHGMAELSVRDDGIGIKPEDVPKLFDRYYRVGGDSTISGFGIGLYLCKEIIDRHNGTIRIVSEPGKGSTFYFTLPVVA